MRKLQAMLVDDEPLALRRLARALEAVDGVKVVAQLSSARRAVEAIAREKLDLLFLDISMPGLDGFELLHQLPSERRPAVIFVTAHDAHAVRAFGVDAADYLLKPVAPERLAQAVDRARVWLRGHARAEGEAAQALAALDSLWAYRHREFVRVRIEDVEWVSAEGDYVRLHGADGGGLMRMTLSALEGRLDPELFLRVHRSAICRRTAITGVRRKATGALTATLASGAEVPVGRSFAGGLRALLQLV